MLTGGFPIVDKIVQLESLTLHTTPHFDPDGGSDPYVIVSNQEGKDLFDSRNQLIPKHFKGEALIELPKTGETFKANKISGDFKVVIWDKDANNAEKMCWLWLNSNFVTGKEGESSKMTLNRDSIDNCHKDKKMQLFDAEFKITLAFKVLKEGVRKKITPSTAVSLGKFNERNE